MMAISGHYEKLAHLHGKAVLVVTQSDKNSAYKSSSGHKDVK